MRLFALEVAFYRFTGRYLYMFTSYASQEVEEICGLNESLNVEKHFLAYTFKNLFKSFIRWVRCAERISYMALYSVVYFYMVITDI